MCVLITQPAGEGEEEGGTERVCWGILWGCSSPGLACCPRHVILACHGVASAPLPSCPRPATITRKYCVINT